MRIRTGEVIQVLIVAAFFGIAYYFLPLLPERMASHWDINGHVNGWMPKSAGLFVFPVMSALVTLILMASARMDFNGKSVAPFRGAYEFFCITVLLFFFYVYCLMIAFGMGKKFDMAQMMAPGFSALMLSIGALIGKSTPNYIIGIRTRALIENPEKWDEVHKKGAGYFKIGAVICLLGMVFPEYMFFFSIVPLIVITVILVVTAGSVKNSSG
jgi:uncharacterized membrane protein